MIKRLWVFRFGAFTHRLAAGRVLNGPADAFCSPIQKGLHEV